MKPQEQFPGTHKILLSSTSSAPSTWAHSTTGEHPVLNDQKNSKPPPEEYAQRGGAHSQACVHSDVHFSKALLGMFADLQTMK